MLNKILLLIFCFYPAKGFNQNLSIGFSIEWRNEIQSMALSPMQKNESVNLPYLVITYRNNTTNPIYFRSVIGSDEQFLPFPSDGMINSPRDLPEMMLKQGKHKLNVFEVKSTDLRHFGRMWEIFSSGKKEVDYTTEIINYEISDIQQALTIQKLLDSNDTGKRLSCFLDSTKEVISYKEAISVIGEIQNNNEIKFEFNSKDFDNNIMNNEVKGQFIFLKKDEVFIQKYNLLAFYILGGTYSFSLFENELSDYVLGDAFFDKGKERWIYKKIKLPKKVDSFMLFKGHIQVNPITIEIK